MATGPQLTTATAVRPNTVRTVYRPRGAARELFSRRDPEVLLAGAAGTGKSLAALQKIHASALHTPGSRYLIVRKVLASLGSTGLQTWRQHVIPDALALGAVDYYGGSSEHPPQYRYSNGSVVLIGGMDRPSKIMSSELDMIFVQEATELTVTDWEALTTRLRNNVLSYQQLIADCNPAQPTHWLKLRCDAGATTMLYSQHKDNPTLFNDDGTMTERGIAYIAKLDALTGVRKARLRYGQWAAAEGMIYDEWDSAVNLVDGPRTPPDDWERIWTVDFGFNHPFVLQCWAIDPDGRGYLYREIFHSRRLVEDHARQILSLVTRKDGTWTEPRPTRIVCDHDAEDRATLERHLDMATTAAEKTVSDGLQAVQARIRPADDGKPRLFIVRGCTVERDQVLAEAGLPASTEEEIPGYVWNPAKDAPVKAMDDGMDSMRYFVADQDLGRRPNVRWL